MGECVPDGTAVPLTVAHAVALPEPVALPLSDGNDETEADGLNDGERLDDPDRDARDDADPDGQ